MGERAQHMGGTVPAHRDPTVGVEGGLPGTRYRPEDIDLVFHLVRDSPVDEALGEAVVLYHERVRLYRIIGHPSLRAFRSGAFRWLRVSP
jgi:hypothetical protein